MSTAGKAIFGFFILFGAFIVASASSVQAIEFPGQGSPAGGPPSVADCVERMGKTESECQEMMEKMKSGERPKMTVADCVERSGKTESECKEMAARMKDGSQPPMNEGRGGAPMQGGGKMEGRTMAITEALSVRAERQKFERTRVYEGVTERTEKFIDYLKSKEIDTTTAEALFVTFKAKADSVLTTFDTYIAALKTWEGDRSESSKLAVADAKSALKAQSTEVKVYYRETLLPTLRTLVDSMSE